MMNILWKFFFYFKTIDYWEQLDGRAKQKLIEWMLERIPPHTPNLTRYIKSIYTIVFLIFLFNSFFLDYFQLNINCFIFVAWVDAGNVYWKIDVYIIEKIFL